MTPDDERLDSTIYRSRCSRGVRVLSPVCAGSRPARPTQTTINREASIGSNRPTTSGSWSTEVESLCRLEYVEEHAEATRRIAPTAGERAREDRNNGEGKPRGQRRRKRCWYVDRAVCRDPQLDPVLMPANRRVKILPGSRQPVRMGTAVVGSRGLAVENGVWPQRTGAEHGNADVDTDKSVAPTSARANRSACESVCSPGSSPGVAVMTETDSEATAAQTKEYSGYIIVNWRNDEVRYRKTAPRDDANPRELAIPITVEVEVPEVQVPEIDADITVPPAQVEHAIAEEHGDPSGDADA